MLQQNAFDLDNLGPYTIERLLGIAAEAERSLNGGAGYVARDLMERALRCAEFMEKEGLTEARFVGPFGGMPFVKGDRVKIKKGARVYTTHPSWTRAKGGKVVARPYVVTLHRAHEGYASISDDHFRQAEVTWAGTGGYWFWTDANNVEKAS